MTHSNPHTTEQWKQWQSELQEFLDAVEANPHLPSDAVSDTRTKISSYFASISDQPQVTNAGIVNAGKSTLYNALFGTEELFPTADARRTKKREAKTLESLRFVDTPGLDAEVQDEEQARQAYRRSHVILFVHSARQGEYDAQEMEFLTTLRQLFPDKGLRRHSLIPVLTKCAGVGEQLEDIVRKVRRQWKKVVKTPADKIFTVRAKTHLKGLREDKPRLCEHSRIPALREHIKQVITRVSSSRRDLVYQRINSELDALAELLENNIERRKQARMKVEDEVQRKIADLDADVEEFSQRHRRSYKRINC